MVSEAWFSGVSRFRSVAVDELDNLHRALGVMATRLFVYVTCDCVALPSTGLGFFSGGSTVSRGLQRIIPQFFQSHADIYAEQVLGLAFLLPAPEVITLMIAVVIQDYYFSPETLPVQINMQSRG